MKTSNPIISKIVTEKATNLERGQVYVFEVNPKSSKTQIAQAIRELYGEKPLSVRVATRPPQSRKVGKMRREVKTAVRKLAYVHTKNPISNLVKA